MGAYFAYGRTALKHGLLAYGLCSDQKILVPDYVCEAVVQPLRQLGLVPIFYPLTDRLEPEWATLECLVKKHSCVAILMVHYFGQPQAIEKFRGFADENGLALVEDNAHGFGGQVNGKLLGTFGDVGFSSPRKILDTQSGGILYLKGVAMSAPQLSVLPVNHAKMVVQRVFRKFPWAKLLCYRLARRMPSWENPAAFVEPEISDLQADKRSQSCVSQAIVNGELLRCAHSRRKQWMQWHKLFARHGIKPVYEQGVYSESSPWMVPGYAPLKEVRGQFVAKALIHGVMVQSWPTLPPEVLEQDHKGAVERWHRLICVPLNLNFVPDF